MATNSQDNTELRRALRTTKSYNYEATTNDQHTEKHQRISRQRFNEEVNSRHDGLNHLQYYSGWKYLYYLQIIDIPVFTVETILPRISHPTHSLASMVTHNSALHKAKSVEREC